MFCFLNSNAYMLFIVSTNNWYSYGVAIPPVASHAYGWTPVQISTVLAAQAVVLFFGMVTSMLLSMTKAPDIMMIGIGNLCFVVGGIITYYTWTSDSGECKSIGRFGEVYDMISIVLTNKILRPLPFLAASWQFVVPIIIVSLAYPCKYSL